MIEIERRKEGDAKGILYKGFHDSWKVYVGNRNGIPSIGRASEQPEYSVEHRKPSSTEMTIQISLGRAACDITGRWACGECNSRQASGTRLVATPHEDLTEIDTLPDGPESNVMIRTYCLSDCLSSVERRGAKRR